MEWGRVFFWGGGFNGFFFRISPPKAPQVLRERLKKPLGGSSEEKEPRCAKVGAAVPARAGGGRNRFFWGHLETLP